MHINSEALEISYELSELDHIAKTLLEKVNSKVLVFNGEMGSGKTTLIKSLVKILGSEDEVSSPTFSIVNEYESNNDIIYHFDLYRIKDIEEAYNFGIEDYLNSDHWIFIEWPEKIKDMLPKGYNVVDIKNVSKSVRALRLKN